MKLFFGKDWFEGLWPFYGDDINFNNYLSECMFWNLFMTVSITGVFIMYCYELTYALLLPFASRGLVYFIVVTVVYMCYRRKQTREVFYLIMKQIDPICIHLLNTQSC